MSDKDNPVLFEITEGIHCEVSKFKGKTRVDIRKWFLNDEELIRTRKGINLSLEEWDEFLKNLAELKEFINTEKIKLEE